MMSSASPVWHSPRLVQMISPPPSPEFEDLPVIATDESGMIAEDEQSKSQPSHVRAVKRRRTPRKARQKITYVSRHFTEEALQDADCQQSETAESSKGQMTTPPTTPLKSTQGPRIYYGLNVDELSSDSSLTDVPDDLGPDPFSYPHDSLKPAFELQAVKTKTKGGKRPTKSPYFPHPHKHRSTFLSTLPFPPLSAPKFGIMQERLAYDPFRLLIATIFLNKTPGERAMPVFYRLMEKYPTPKALAEAEVADVTAIIQHLGFQNQRARKCVAMAKTWLERPPERGKRYKKLNYPVKRDGRDVKEDEAIGDEDERVAWEISHLPGLGPYSHDSWRMFCRDKLRGVATSWQGEDAEEGFEPEWKRVVPLDKELRAYLTWAWLKEGWMWDKETGKRTKAGEELMERARGGGVVLEERNKNILTIRALDGELVEEKKSVAKPTGEILKQVAEEHEFV